MVPNQPIDVFYDDDGEPYVAIPDLEPDELHIALSLWWADHVEI